MQLSLNNITYGNPNYNQKKALLEICLVDSLFPKLKNFPFPENESDSTKQELNEIVGYLKDIELPENLKFRNRYLFYDKNLFQAIKNTFINEKIDLDELISDIDKDITGLILKLKFHYQRPRPYQLANYYKLKLFPYKSTSSNSPSYPSGHTTQAFVILNIIGNLIPELNDKCMKMIEDVADSRCYIGNHYSTDNDFAYQVGKEILKHPEFVKKYGI
jgi:hypothetical protein